MNKQKGFMRITKGSIGETNLVKTRGGFRAQRKLEVQPEDLKKILLFYGASERSLSFGVPLYG